MPKAEKDYSTLDLRLIKNIPETLKLVPQWVGWRLHKVAGKDRQAKIPVSPLSGKEASINDPRTWGTFDQAIKACSEYKLQGIGFVFTAADPYTGIDIDDCREPATGELGDWARAIVESIDSYTEVSPSGTGVKIFIEGITPGLANRRNKIEIYSHSRYFTVTGDIFGTNTLVNSRQGELVDLYKVVFGAEADEKSKPKAETKADPKLARVQKIPDADLLERARSAANGEKFSSLYDRGETTAYDGDHSRADAALASLLAYWTRGDMERVDRLFRASRLMRPKWDEQRGEKKYGEKTLTHAVSGTTALFDPDLDAAMSARHNDTSNAEIFVQLSENKFIWCPEWKAWLEWTGTNWQRDADLNVRRGAELVSEELLRRAKAAGPENIKAEVKWAIQAGDLYRLSAIEQISRTRAYAKASTFDRDIYALCCSNGVVDLRTGGFVDSHRDQWITKNTGIKYLPQAKCDKFCKFLLEIMEGDREMVAYLWRVIGYSLTGSTTERSFFILHGGGRNGKTTFVETIKAVLGPYSQKARFQTFLRKNQPGGANDDIAHLVGARFVAASEADQNVPLDVSLVKELTGSDTIRARHLYGREFEFTPQFKLFFATNHVPPIHESTHSVWDRMHYIPFNYRVPESKVDRALGMKLMGELEGILSMAVLAAKDWFQNGLRPPQKVLKARQDLYDSNDQIGQFLAEVCELGEENFSVVHASLYTEFGFWCKRQGIRYIPSSKAIAAYLREKGYSEKWGAQRSKVWMGLRLRNNTGIEM